MLNQHNNILNLSGEVDFSTVNNLFNKINKLLNNGQNEYIINFFDVTKVDSSAIALLINILKLAKQKNKEIKFNGFPEKLKQLIILSNLSQLLHEN